MSEELALEPAPGVRIVWDRDALESHARGESDRGWRLDGQLGTDFQSLRVLTAAGVEGGVLLIAALRAVAAEGHNSEQVAALLGGPDDAIQPVEEALISTEYGPGDEIRRVGLEIYLPGKDYALRGAGDTVASGESAHDDGQIRFAQLDFRLDGQPGSARLDLMSQST